MADVVLVLIVVGFFALGALYVRGLARMIDRDAESAEEPTSPEATVR